MRLRLRVLLHRAGVLLALAWLGIGLGREIHRTVQRQVVSPPRRVWPTAWRHGTPQTLRLGRFLDRARAHLPPAARVTFASKADPGSAEFFRFLWASYFMPERDVIPSFHSASERRAEFWIVYGHSIDHPRLERVYADQAGIVYRVLPAAPAPGREGAPKESP